ncbi:MAG: transposase [Candidatus Bathyarchaeia archaeon]
MRGYTAGRSIIISRYIFAVDVETREVASMGVATDDAHDSEALPALMWDASRRMSIAEACMDGAYDAYKAYRLFRHMGVKPIVKPRCNARADRGPPERRMAVRLMRRLGDGGWAGRPATEEMGR